MNLKIYKSVTGVQYSFLLNKKSSGTVCVTFRGSNKMFQTKDEELQKLIEETRYYKEKNIVLAQTVSGEKAKERKSDPIDYADVDSLQSAADVLVTEYGYKPEQVNTPIKVKTASSKVGISFPNLIS